MLRDWRGLVRQSAASFVSLLISIIKPGKRSGEAVAVYPQGPCQATKSKCQATGRTGCRKMLQSKCFTRGTTCLISDWNTRKQSRKNFHEGFSDTKLHKVRIERFPPPEKRVGTGPRLPLDLFCGVSGRLWGLITDAKAGQQVGCYPFRLAALCCICRV